MKRINLIIVSLLFLCAFVKADNINSFRHIEDSIILKFNSINDQRQKYDYISDSFYKYIGNDSSINIIKYSLKQAKKHNLLDEECRTYFDFISYYQHRYNLNKMEYYLQKMKNISDITKHYYNYFLAWGSLVDYYIDNEESEKTFFVVKKMFNEAKKAKSLYGELQSYMCFGTLYANRGDFKKALEYYNLAINIPCATETDRYLIYGKRSEIYVSEKKYDLALKELNLKKNSIFISMKEEPQIMHCLLQNMLDCELSFCEVYYELSDRNKLLKHLKGAELYYESDCFLPYYIRYHVAWANYYSELSKWNQGIKEYDMALSRCSDNQIVEKSNVMLHKADLLFKAGKYEEATILYKYVAAFRDSIKNEIVNNNIEIHSANKKINEILISNAKRDKMVFLVILIIVLLTLFILLFVIIRSILLSRLLKKTQKSIIEENIKVEKVNKLKEVFLKNIDFEIRTPLNAVSGFAAIICSDDNLSVDELKEYSQIIKTNSDMLLRLVTKILDYSRLESGMMKFNIEECDAVQLCKDSKMLFDMKQRADYLLMKSECYSALIDSDSSRFMMLLNSLFLIPEDYGNDKKIECNINTENNYLRIAIKDSPLLYLYKKNQEYRIQNNINQLFLNKFKATYEIIERGSQSFVFIKYPLKVK